MNKDKDELDFSNLDSVADFLANEAPTERSLMTSQSMKEKFLDSTFKEEWQKKNSARFKDQSFIEKHKKACWHNEDMHNKRRKSLSMTWQKPEVIARAKKNTAELWKDPEWVAKVNANRTKANKTAQVKEKRRKAEAEKWANKEKKLSILKKSGQAKPIASNKGVFVSVAEAAKFHNMSYGMVRERLLGKVKTNEHNFRFISWDEYDKIIENTGTPEK